MVKESWKGGYKESPYDFADRKAKNEQRAKAGLPPLPGPTEDTTVSATAKTASDEALAKDKKRIAEAEIAKIRVQAPAPPAIPEVGRSPQENGTSVQSSADTEMEQREKEKEPREVRQMGTEFKGLELREYAPTVRGKELLDRIDKLLELKKSLDSNVRLAREMHLPQSEIHQLFRCRGLSNEVRNVIEKGVMPLSKVVVISRFPKPLHLAVSDALLSGKAKVSRLQDIPWKVKNGIGSLRLLLEEEGIKWPEDFKDDGTSKGE